MSYECRVYESVDGGSLYKIISKKGSICLFCNKPLLTL